jgi:hypothetical protein
MDSEIEMDRKGGVRHIAGDWGYVRHFFIYAANFSNIRIKKK